MLRDRRVRARGAFDSAQPRFVPWVYAFMRLVSPIYCRLAEGISGIQTRGVERLIAAYRRFYGGEVRLLIAFRHTSVHDPPVMVQLISRILPREARRRRGALGGLPHAHFLYGRNLVLWAGGGAAFLIPRIGALPVANRRADSRALGDVRRYLTEGPHPMALAPEGQVTYHNHVLGPLEAGSAKLAVWGAEDLEKNGSPRELLLLPVALEYRYPDPARLLERLVARIARVGGLVAPGPGPAHGRLLDLTGQLLDKVEAYYARFFGGTVAPEPAGLRERVERVCDVALRVPERFMRLRSEGDLLGRLFTVRQRAWDFLFRADVPAADRASALDRLLADRLADEAYLQLRHNELVDVLEYVRPDYIGPEASANRLVEYALNLADVENRLLGGDISGRYSPRGKRVRIRVGEPLEVRRLCAAAGGGTRSRTAAVLEAMRASLEDLSSEKL